MTEGNEKMKTIDAASDTYAFSSYLSFGVWIALSGLVLFALIACLLRPSGDFGLARRPKGFWMGALGAGALVMVAAGGRDRLGVLPRPRTAADGLEGHMASKASRRRLRSRRLVACRAVRLVVR